MFHLWNKHHLREQVVIQKQRIYKFSVSNFQEQDCTCFRMKSKNHLVKKI